MDWLQLGNACSDLNIYIKKFTPSKSLLEAGLEAVDNIVKNYPSPYYLMCSGGVDSQALAYIWKESGYNYQCVSFLYTDNNGKFYNTHDIDTFHVFAKQNNIDYTTKIFNYWSFLDNDLLTIAKQYNCASPQITAYIALANSLQTGTVIFSGNFFYPDKPPFDFDILALYRYSLQSTSPSVIPFFFAHTEDLAFIGRTLTQPHFYNDYQSKCYVYKESGIPIIEQDTKLSGFELIKDYFDNVPNLISPSDRLRYASKPSKRQFDIAYRYKLRDQLGPHPTISIF